MKGIAALPAIWGMVAGVTVTENTGVSIGLIVVGATATILLVWRTRGAWDSMRKRIRHLEERMDKKDKEP
jgi:Na+/H+-translocating membrane pyrophosphatase